VKETLAEWRIKPGASYFPRPDEIATEIERQREARSRTATAQRSQRETAEREAWFWKWVGERVAIEDKTEQEILDSVRTPGYTGRKARG
jgi:hypothetical protein